MSLYPVSVGRSAPTELCSVRRLGSPLRPRRPDSSGLGGRGAGCGLGPGASDSARSLRLVPTCSGNALPHRFRCAYNSSVPPRRAPCDRCRVTLGSPGGASLDCGSYSSWEPGLRFFGLTISKHRTPRVMWNSAEGKLVRSKGGGRFL